jgi:hypothetical protein
MFLFSTHSQESRGRLPLHAGERFDGEYRLLTGEDSDTMQQLGACLLLQPFATRNLKTSYPHISDTRGLMLLYCASSARISYMRVAKILTSVDAVLREGITQKRPIYLPIYQSIFLDRTAIRVKCSSGSRIGPQGREPCAANYDQGGRTRVASFSMLGWAPGSS